MRYIILIMLMASTVYAGDYSSIEGTGAVFITDNATGETSTITVNYTNDQIANAIYLAEGGGKKASHAYGVLKHYVHTSPRQACLNTIKHARKDFKGGDFIAFLGSRYAPEGVSNDPTGLNANWVRNVKSILRRG